MSTLVDASYPPPSPGLIAGYAILTVVSLLCACRAYHLGSTRSHYYHIYTVRFLFPLASVVLALENATLAASGQFSRTAETSPDGTISTAQQSFLYFVYVCVAVFEVPSLLLATFELTYLVHKRRSVNFCGMFFDEGQRIRRMITTPIKSFVLRNFIRFIAILLATMGIVVNFAVIQDAGTPNTSTSSDGNNARDDPRCGWVCLFRDERSMDEKLPILLSLIPTAVLVLCNTYFAFLLWRYGTESSMVVHASILNPWFSLSFGVGALVATQIFGYPPYFPCTSNLGLLIFIVSILLLMVEVDKDMVADDEFAGFLASVSKLGDRVRVMHASERIEEGDSARIQETTVVESRIQERHVLAATKNVEGRTSERISDHDIGTGGSVDSQDEALDIGPIAADIRDGPITGSVVGERDGTGDDDVPRTIQASISTADAEVGTSSNASVGEDDDQRYRNGAIPVNGTKNKIVDANESRLEVVSFDNEEDYIEESERL